jgi:hypothetical protein
MNEAAPDRYVRRFRVLRLPAPRLRGTFAPFFLASDRPIAIACFRLFTVPPFPPRPDFSVPFFRRRIALATRFDAARPYRGDPVLRRARLRAAMTPSA